MTANITKKDAVKFVVLMGILSLLADMTYEGARSITGPYLGTLGASGAIVGFVAGFGEFFGYGLRLFSGYFVDRSHRYWLIAILGYFINLLAVPLLALTTRWWTASFLIVAERAGKGIRNPARDAMLSHAAQRMGMGWGFGLHEAMDQTGAMLGPLLVALILYWHGHYQHAFAMLAIPAMAALGVLFISCFLYPDPKTLEAQSKPLAFTTLKANKPFWIYLIGASLVALGYADFALIAYHFGKEQLISPLWIPITYAIALGTNIVMAPWLGHLYDRKGFIVLVMMTAIASLFAPLVFFGNIQWAVLGVIVWGIGYGAQNSLMRAIIGNIVPKEKRGSAYGVFNAIFGVCWFLGSALMGVLYDTSLIFLVIFSVSAQLLALPFLWKARRLLL